MILTFKTEFSPTAEQRTYIKKACGIRRWTWNWAVATYFAEAQANNKFLSAFEMQKMLNNGPVKDPDKAWLSEVNSMARGEALTDFSLSIKAYAQARQRAKRTAVKLPVDKYKPGFQKKGKCTESFRLFKKGGTEFKVHSAHDFSVVTLRGVPRMHIHPKESMAFLMSSDIKTCTFSMKGGKFFISVTYEKTNQCNHCGAGKVGIDLGIHHPLATFNGVSEQIYDLPATLNKAEKKTERCNQRLAHSVKGSKRHQALLLKLQRAYMHEASIKKDWREKVTTELILANSQINIDDFGFEGAKNLDANRALYSVGVYAFKIRPEQKAQTAGARVVYVPRGTPTTRTCSACGEQQLLILKDRVYKCRCGLVIDRDLNAARNVYKYC